MKPSPWRVRPQVVLWLFLLVVAVWGYFVAVRDPIFRNFDQADMALAARNMISGKGFTTDAMWFWMRDWGSPRHPEDSWPPLQAILAAVSFLVLGPTVPAYQAVVICFLIALLWTTYEVGRRLVGSWEGVVAALIVFSSPLLIGMADLGTNDVGAAFLYLAAMYLIYRSFDESAGARWVIAAAVVTGLSINQKFQGILFVISFCMWQLLSLKSNPRRIISRSLLFLAVLIVMGLPLAIRNMLAFGQLGYPTSKALNSLASAWDPMYHRWRMNIVFYKPFWKHELPTYVYILRHRGARYLFMQRPWYEIKRFLLTLASFDVVTGLNFLFGLLGVFIGLGRCRRWTKWSGMVILCSLSYIIFGHMESRYFVIYIPIMAIFSAMFILWAARRFKSLSVGLAALFALIVMSLFANSARPCWKGAVAYSPSLDALDQRVLAICDLLKRNLKPGEGVISYRGAEMAFATGRYGACPPNVDLAEFIELADRYKLRYMVIEMARLYLRLFRVPGTEYWVQRQLAPLYVGREAYGFKLVYSYGKDWFVYRIPLPGDVDLKSLPRLPPEPEDFTRLLLMPDRGGPTKPPPPLDLGGMPAFPASIPPAGN